MRKMRIAVLTLLGALAITAPVQRASAAAPRGHDPDWPCAQKKVLKLTSSQIWDGPSVDDTTDWQQDEGVAKLVPMMTNRRIPVEQAVELLKKFASDVPAATRSARLVKVFAGMLATVNVERSTVIAGIERFTQRQRARAQELEREGTRIAKLKEAAAADPKAQEELVKAQELFDWNVRVFQERQANTPVACEIPVLIESRLFELAREIRALIPSGG